MSNGIAFNASKENFKSLTKHELTNVFNIDEKDPSCNFKLLLCVSGDKKGLFIYNKENGVHHKLKIPSSYFSKSNSKLYPTQEYETLNKILTRDDVTVVLKREQSRPKITIYRGILPYAEFRKDSINTDNPDRFTLTTDRDTIRLLEKSTNEKKEIDIIKCYIHSVFIRDDLLKLDDHYKFGKISYDIGNTVTKFEFNTIKAIFMIDRMFNRVFLEETNVTKNIINLHDKYNIQANDNDLPENEDIIVTCEFLAAYQKELIFNLYNDSIKEIKKSNEDINNDSFLTTPIEDLPYTSRNKDIATALATFVSVFFKVEDEKFKDKAIHALICHLLNENINAGYSLQDYLDRAASTLLNFNKKYGENPIS
ncbi:hypothetical protein [Salinivibrio proteolyticus]|uniref:Uncharacterized protein n=1 Tax=Salinivibrio proteolyticus TaxID=334715 RepID=A0ABY7LH90_9GAMM|nr:hypothetical protein [Salinivibrio proteolyticus]WBA16565.1 hypothetical protein N7E60_14360 [Salinivibrio proteolyticus]